MVIKKIARTAALKAWRSPVARWLRDVPPSVPPPAPLRVFATFTDSQGAQFEMLDGYRDRLKPAWRTMFDTPLESLREKSAADAPIGGRNSVRECLEVLAACGVELDGGRALEIGCWTGMRSFGLAAEGGFAVTAIDLPEYYVQQKLGAIVDEAELEQSSRRLSKIRNQVREAFLASGVEAECLSQVTFLDADISRADLPDNHFDLITSWEVLEHLRDPAAALREMCRLLKPGSVAFHEYNPFFCIEGGHSLCTLDFPYGHARLSAEDCADYLQRFRPQEAEVALRFFHYNLNRMTLHDLRQICADLEVELLALVEWPEEKDLTEVSREILPQVQTHYPTATLSDLLARRVWVVFRKPTVWSSNFSLFVR